jgi:hypothetical protein
MNLGWGDIKSVENLNLEIREGKIMMKVAEETFLKHHEVGRVLSGARTNSLIRVNSLGVIKGYKGGRNLFLWYSSREMHSFPKLYICDMES